MLRTKMDYMPMPDDAALKRYESILLEHGITDLRRYYNGICRTFKGNLNGQAVMAKIAGKVRQPDKYQHIERDIQGLSLVQGVPGVVDLVDSFEHDRYPLLAGVAGIFGVRMRPEETYLIEVKEYIKGIELGGPGQVTGTYRQSALENTVRSIHSLGVAQLDLVVWDIEGDIFHNILYDGQRDHLFDFGSSVLRKDIPRTLFERAVKQDLHDLEAYFG